MKRSDAPWSAEQVASLNAYQQNPGTHPFTGERDAGGGETVLVATRAGWVEREGGPVVQTWAHRFMTDWSWARQQTTKARNEVVGFVHRICDVDALRIGAASVFCGHSMEYSDGHVVISVYQTPSAAAVGSELEVSLPPSEARAFAALLLEKASELERIAPK